MSRLYEKNFRRGRAPWRGLFECVIIIKLTVSAQAALTKPRAAGWKGWKR